MESPALIIFLGIVVTIILIRKLGFSLIGLLLFFVLLASAFPNDVVAQRMVEYIKVLLPVLLVVFAITMILFGKSK